MAVAALGTTAAEALAAGPLAALSAEPLYAGAPPTHWQGAVKPHHVLFLDNRAAPHLFHDMFSAYLGETRNEAPSPANPLIGNPRARSWVERALPIGTLRDSLRIRHGVRAVNRFASFGPQTGIQPLEFQFVHARTQIRLLHDTVVRDRLVPAGLVFSGSPSMVNLADGPSSVILPEDDAVFTQTAELMEFGLEHLIPMKAICYGGQLLLYVRYGRSAVTRWMVVPEGMTHRVLDHAQPSVYLPVTPGARHRNFGVLPVVCDQPDHFLARGAESGVLAIKSHSQGLVFRDPAGLSALGIPATDLIASSSRVFVNAEGGTLTERVVEVVQAGLKAFILQFHPEVLRDLARVLTAIPDFGASLEREGYGIESVVLPGLENYPEEPGTPGGHVFGSNWFMYVLLPHYIEILLEHRGELTRIQIAHLERVRERLYQENPNMPT